MKKTFSGIVIASACIYAFILYIFLFAWPGRQMVVVSEQMLDNFNYWNSVNLSPFKTITEYITAIVDGGARGHAIRNLFGNLFLLFPVGFYLPFFVKKMSKAKPYCIVVAAVIVIIEIVQLATKSGSLDIDDFILNFAGALIGYIAFTRTPMRKLFNLRAWSESGGSNG